MHYHIVITGRVQGVFFRAFIKEKAVALGLEGKVWNNGSGAVEVLVEGSKSAVRELVNACKSGPSSASVERVRVRSVDGSLGFGKFYIDYSR